MLAAKIVFGILFLIASVLGFLMFRNFDRVIGSDAGIPSENESSRLLNKSQFVVVWLLSMKLFAMMVWIL